MGQIQIGLGKLPSVGMGQIQIGLENLPSVLTAHLKVAGGLDSPEIEIGSEDLLCAETSRIWMTLSND